ncbi:caspase recruitment domain-containing protein 8-like isoform X1 [Grus americana]|uniref:caspase recruitment domain-containing protein 8-like isoform X1 n=1 Tax=Grus americana TaxID=9117 RepID=UPI00240889ED|nr:caspase recruitment domain-containing protein 8-like isoform X1 [Grus americana]
MAERDAMAEQQQVADNPGEFSIFIKNLHGKALAVTVSPDDSVWELKAKLNAQDSSLIPEMGVLIYGSRQMEDHLTLRHYKITPNCLLHYRLSLRGGGAGVKSELPVTGLALKKLVADPPKFLTAKASGSTEESYDWLNLGSPLQGNCWRCTGENLPEVTPEITQDTLKYHTTYRAHLPGAGVFQCSITGLSFEVRSAVTITYRYRTWTRHLSKAAQEMWVPAGPLFRIDVQPGIVRAVHLPHFICLAEDINTSLCSIAHFKSGKMTLERPTRVVAFSAVLENPSFSLLGVLWRRLRSTLNSFPMHSLVLIFQQLSAANTTLHLYLIPDDNSVKQAIERQEMNWNSKLIPKPPPFNPLFFGRVYQVTSTNSVVITPESHLPFCYKSPKEQQLFVEIYIRNMAEEIGLLMTDTRNDTVVWRASLRSGDINLPACVSKTSSAFMKQHKTELCSRMRQLSTILLHLRDANVINSDEEEEVQGQNTSQRKNRVLLELAEKKGLEAQEQLYQILRMKDPYLITDLEKSS